MKPIRFVRVEVRAPKWDPNPEKSKTNNHLWRKGLFFVFRDYDGNEFDFMPRWDELELMRVSEPFIEEVNRCLAKKASAHGKDFEGACEK